MVLSELIEKLKEIQNRLTAYLPEIIRPFSLAMEWNDRAVLLTGPRGAGKTTLLLNIIKLKHYLYLSADAPIISGVSLYDIAEAAFMKGYDGIVIDEVHFARDWALHLKGIYDAFPGKTVYASDSSSVVLKQGIADLSRRFVIKRVPLLSFREYLGLRSLGHFAVMDPFNADRDKAAHMLKSVNILRHFQEYLENGFRPLFMENPGSYSEKVQNIVEKIMLHDIPFLVPQLSENHFRLMRAVIGYIAGSKIPSLAVNSLCADWNLSKEKLYQLLTAMEECSLIRAVRKKGEKSVHSKGEKIFFSEPSLYRVYDGLTGNIREAFVACAFSEAGKTVFASGDEQRGDFLISGKLVEVGGLNKNKKNADYVIRDNLDLPDERKIPLWLVGMQY